MSDIPRAPVFSPRIKPERSPDWYQGSPRALFDAPLMQVARQIEPAQRLRARVPADWQWGLQLALLAGVVPPNLQGRYYDLPVIATKMREDWQRMGLALFSAPEADPRRPSAHELPVLSLKARQDWQQMGRALFTPPEPDPFKPPTHAIPRIERLRVALDWILPTPIALYEVVVPNTRDVFRPALRTRQEPITQMFDWVFPSPFLEEPAPVVEDIGARRRRIRKYRTVRDARDAQDIVWFIQRLIDISPED